MNTAALLDSLSQRAFELLVQHRQVLVTAESCTAGLIAATLARVPGMSAVLAGGLVVYQVASKTEWLGISYELIEREGVVSRAVAEAMASQALVKTPHATIAVSITGHLGPDAPMELDGIAWSAIAQRGKPVLSERLPLSRPDESTLSARDEAARGQAIRIHRQQDAVRQVLEILCEQLSTLH